MDHLTINQLPSENLRSKRVFVPIDVDEHYSPTTSDIDEIKLRASLMGSHGLSGMLRLIMGSVSKKILDRAKCAVMIVRIPDKTMVKAGLVEK